MHLVTVVAAGSPGSSTKAYVMAKDLQELISSAVTELDLNASEKYTVFQEPTGIKIGSDGVLQLLAGNCEKLQQTLEVSLRSPADVAPNIPHNNRPSTQILTERNINSESETCMALPMKPLVELLDPVMAVINNPEALSPKAVLKMKKTAVKEVYSHIAKFMLRTAKVTSLPSARQYAKSVISYKDHKYSKLFEIKVGSTIVNNGVGTLALQVYNHLNYYKGDDQKKKRGKRKPANLNLEPEGDVDGDLMEVQMDKSTIDYGCRDYAPLLPEEETVETQENKRQRLSVIDAHDPEAKTLFEETYCSQRSELNRAVPLSSKLLPVLERWPLLTIRDYLFIHSARLLGKQVLDTWLNNLGSRSRHFNDFMMVHWTNEHDKKAGPLTRSMMDMLDSRSDAFESIGQMANNICFFPLLINYMKENQNQLFIVMPKNSTDEDMMQSAKQQSACPLLVVRGTSIFEEEANFDVVILGRKSMKAINFVEGVLMVFVSYFIFGFQYPSKISRSLEFLQRFLLDINPEKGTRREKPCRLVDGLDSKVRELSERLAYHGSNWGL